MVGPNDVIIIGSAANLVDFKISFGKVFNSIGWSIGNVRDKDIERAFLLSYAHI
jgi:hypothetical protein